MGYPERSVFILQIPDGFKMVSSKSIFSLIGSGILLVNCWTNPVWKDALDPSKSADRTPAILAILAFFSPGVGSIKIANAIDGGKMESGFLKGTSDGDTQTVMVSLDGGLPQPAVGTSAWSYGMPTGSNTWAYNSKHTITAYAMDSKGKTIGAEVITVRKGRNKDIDGDGAADLVILNGGDGYNSPQFANVIYLVYSGSLKGTSMDISFANAKLTAASDLNEPLSAPFLEDFDSDGYADLTTLMYDDSARDLYLFTFFSKGTSGISSSQYSSAGGADSIILCTYCDIPDVGDFNADGYPDLALPYYNTTQQIVLILSGNGKSFAEFNQQQFIDVGSQDYIALITGDLDGNQYSDLASIDYSSYPSIRTYLGSNPLGSSSAEVVNPCNLSDTYDVPTRLMTDMTGDGLEDLLFADIWAGNVFLLESKGNGSFFGDCSTAKFTWNQSNIMQMRLSAGYFDGDGLEDLVTSEVIGYTGPFSGSAKMYLSGGSQVSSSSVSIQIYDSASTYDGGLGWDMESADFNGDGLSDIVIGAPVYGCTGYGDPNVFGRAYIFFGNKSGFTSLDVQNADTTITTQSPELLGSGFSGGKNFSSLELCSPG